MVKPNKGTTMETIGKPLGQPSEGDTVTNYSGIYLIGAVMMRRGCGV